MKYLIVCLLLLQGCSQYQPKEVNIYDRTSSKNDEAKLVLNKVLRNIEQKQLKKIKTKVIITKRYKVPKLCDQPENKGTFICKK